MRMFERHTGHSALHLGREGQVVALPGHARRAIGARAAAGIEIEIIGAGALVRVGHGAAFRQPTSAGHRDRAVHAARTRRRRHQQAAALAVEAVRHLRQYAMRMTRARHGRERRKFAARHRRGAAVNLTVATARGEIGDAAPVAPDRPSPQFDRGRRSRIGERRRRKAAQSRDAEARGQQVIAVAMGRRALGAEHDRFPVFDISRGTRARGASGHGQHQRQGHGQPERGTERYRGHNSAP